MLNLDIETSELSLWFFSALLMHYRCVYGINEQFYVQSVVGVWILNGERCFIVCSLRFSTRKIEVLCCLMKFWGGFDWNSCFTIQALVSSSFSSTLCCISFCDVVYFIVGCQWYKMDQGTGCVKCAVEFWIYSGHTSFIEPNCFSTRKSIWEMFQRDYTQVSEKCFRCSTLFIRFYRTYSLSYESREPWSSGRFGSI